MQQQHQQQQRTDRPTQPGVSDGLSYRLDSLNMQHEAPVIAVPLEGGGVGGEEDPRASPLGPEARRRLMVAAMSPEDIVLCVDVGPEMGSEWAGAGPGGTATSRMRVVKVALSGFVRRKASFNQGHRFAVCALGGGVRVVRGMTQDIRSVLEAIERLQPMNPPDTLHHQEDIDDTPFNFSELLACLAERFPPPKPSSSLSRRVVAGRGGGLGATSQVRPVVRALVVYGRSFTCPLVPASPDEKPALLSHERFFLDCIYVHRKPSEEGVVCQEAFDLIVTMETSEGGSNSYFLECGHNMQRFNTSMASLLAHPAQRDYQDKFFDKLTLAGDAGGGSSGTGGQASRSLQSSSGASSSSPPLPGISSF